MRSVSKSIYYIISKTYLQYGSRFTEKYNAVRVLGKHAYQRVTRNLKTAMKVFEKKVLLKRHPDLK